MQWLDPLSQKDGLDPLRRIWSFSDVPVIITSAQGSNEIDGVVGLQLGADDYVTKPFNLRELVARIPAVPIRILRGGSTVAELGDDGR
jgi:two-component system, OmpR family, response regulator